MIEINSIDEMKKYYNEGHKTYIFPDDVEFKIGIETMHSIKAYNIRALNISALNIDALNIDVCDIEARTIKANSIDAFNIDAMNINAFDINACGIKAGDIEANDIISDDIDAKNISYYAICIARHSFECERVKGRRKNSIHKCLDSEIKYKVVEEK